MIRVGNDLFMYYTGWSPSVITPFQNFLGLAISKDNGLSFTRYGTAPILDRSNEDPFSIGSSCIVESDNKLILFYTSFRDWLPLGNKFSPSYSIKSAYSEDGISWSRQEGFILDGQNSSDCICRPSIIKMNEYFHMWYCFREKDKDYQIAKATSKNGLDGWSSDKSFTFPVDLNNFGDQGQSYPTAFLFRDQIIVIHAGPEYGKLGLGAIALIS